MANTNIGTLISSTIRPNSPLDLIATAYSSEVKGGLHTVNLSSDRDAIIYARRDWGMLCYVTSESTMYQLQYGRVDTNINNNSNWVVFNSGSTSGGNTNTDWLNPVISLSNIPPTSPNDGDRYLVTAGASGLWTGMTDNIAQWDSLISSWTFSVPSNGVSVLVNNKDNSIYRYGYTDIENAYGFSASLNTLTLTLSDSEYGNISNQFSNNDGIYITGSFGATYAAVSSVSYTGGIGTQIILNDNIGFNGSVIFIDTNNPFSSKADIFYPAINYPTTRYYKGWNTQLLNQVRFITATSGDGVNFTSYSSPLFNSYNVNNLFLTIFATANSGTYSTLNINGLGSTTLMKLYGNGLSELSAGDIVPGIIYKLAFDGIYFQIEIPTSAVGVIGAAESGTYVNGLFTDFTPNTPIGTPIDRFNEILKSLVPPSAPVLSDWSGVDFSYNVNGKLSFDSTHPVAGSATYSGADLSPSPVSVDGSWSIGGKRLGITAIGANISGVLNYQVPVNINLPIPSYVTASFGNGNIGHLNMFVNGITVSSIDLSTVGSTSSGSNTGFTLTATTSSKFPIGTAFTEFMNRTGTWQLSSGDPNIVNGYNYIYVSHINATGSATFSHILNRFEFIQDDSVISTSITNGTFSSYTLTGVKYLSGIQYYTGGNFLYDVTINNLYRNTYYPLSDAITFSDQSTGSYTPILSTSQTLSLAPCYGSQSKQFKISNLDQNGSSLTFSVISSGKRLLNNSIGLGVTAKRTIQGTTTGGTALINNILLDNVLPSSSFLVENFDDEIFRLKNTYGSFNYDYYSLIGSNIWDFTQYLSGVTNGYSNGSQVYNSQLIYPTTNFSSIGNSQTNINYGNSNTNYSTLTGNRVYIRYFRQTSPTTGNFTMTINGSGGTFVPLVVPLTGNNIWVEIKAPGSSGAVTGWMDAFQDFVTGTWTDGSGARNAAGGVGRLFGTPWGLTIGTLNTASTSGYMLIRITIPQTFTGYIDSITWQYV